MKTPKKKLRKNKKSPFLPTSKQAKKVSLSPSMKATLKRIQERISKHKDTFSRKRKYKHPETRFVRAYLSDEYIEHINKHKHCEQCQLCENTHHSVFVRGSWECTDNRKIQPDLMFIGASPNHLDSLFGIPFAGTQGKVLERIISSTNMLLKGKRGRLKYLYTHLTACVPNKTYIKSTPPLRTHADACEARLTELIQLASPKNIILLGKVTKRLFKPNHHNLSEDCQIIEFPHPEAMLRMTQAKYEIEFTRCVVKLAKLFYPNWDSLA